MCRSSFVARIDGRIVGHVLVRRAADRPRVCDSPGVGSGTLAVLPEYQRRGIGTRLTRHGLEACQKQGHRIVVVLGHPDFYRRFGFSSEFAACLDSAFSGKPAFMAMELAEGALKGVSGKVRYPAAFGIA